MNFCDFCDCEDCRKGETHFTNYRAQVEDGRFICEVCYNHFCSECKPVVVSKWVSNRVKQQH